MVDGQGQPFPITEANEADLSEICVTARKLASHASKPHTHIENDKSGRPILPLSASLENDIDMLGQNLSTE